MKNRSSWIVRIGVLALVLTMVSTTMMSGTLARYVTTSIGGAKAIIAKWDPKVAITNKDGDKDMITTTTYSLGDLMDTVTNESAIGTRGTPGDEHNVIAPGTQGSIKMVVTPTQQIEAGRTTSEVAMKVEVYAFYVSDEELVIPENLVFKLHDTSATTEYTSGAQSLTRIGQATWATVADPTNPAPTYMSIEELQKTSGYQTVAPIADVTIPAGRLQSNPYNMALEWEWKYQQQANATLAQVEANRQADIKDTKAGRDGEEIQMQFLVRLVQVDPTVAAS